MDDKLKAELKDAVAEVVASIFSEKKEEDMRKKAEEALNDSAKVISELTESLEAKTTELATAMASIEEYEDKISELGETVKAHADEMEKKDIKISASTEKITTLETKLVAIEQAQLAASRYTELEEAGVARKDKDGQIARIKGLSDEEFASYKAELVSVRESVLASIEEKGSDDSSSDDSDGVDTPPANVAKSGKEQAAMNMESGSKKIEDRYAELGKVLAARWTGKKEAN